MATFTTASLRAAIARIAAHLEACADELNRLDGALGDGDLGVTMVRGARGLVEAAPKGLFLVGPPAVELDGDRGTGEQPLCFVDQTNHEMRIGWYTDSYRRTPEGWRLRTRSMTFLRKSGARDSGRAHDPTRPTPTGA